jgi:flavodoxin
MKSALVYTSVHHGNTEKVARAMAGALGASLFKPEEATAHVVSQFDLLGFGSGIYYSKHHKTLLAFVRRLPVMKNKKVFIFSTAGVSDRAVEKNMSKNHRLLKDMLINKGFDIIGEFSCPGFITWGYFRLLGGRYRDRPNQDDLKRASEFAEGLRTKTQNSGK